MRQTLLAAMKNSLIKNIHFDFNHIKDILDNCSQLEKISSTSDNLTSFTYFDVVTGMKYIISANENSLQIQSGSQIYGTFEETEYVLKVLRALVQTSQEFDKNCLEADKYISSLIGQNVSFDKYSC